MMAEDKKELIRRAGIVVMSREGFYNTKASSIAEEAGIAVGTIYNYFKSKEEILDYIFEIELQKRLKALKDLQDNDRTIWDKLESFLQIHFNEILASPEVGKILVREKDFQRKNGSSHVSAYLTRIPDTLKKILDQAVEKGEITPCKTETISSIIFGSIQGIVEKAISSEQLQLLQEAGSEMIDLLKKGLQS